MGLYFDKYRPFATGITVAGTGVGTFTMAPVMKSILRSYGWQGAIIFQTVLCAVSILCGLVYQPLPKRSKFLNLKTILTVILMFACSTLYAMISSWEQKWQ